jgi:tetratricopeptide (TPR) repeat protein
VLMQEAVKIFPAYFDAHFALSSEMLKAGRFNEAIAELDLARTINPDSDRVYQLFGVALIGLKRYDLAAAVFAEAFRLNPQEPLHLLMRGSALIDFSSTVDPAASKDAAILWYDALNEAEKSLTRADALSNKQLAAVHLQMAWLYHKKGDDARAADELEQYLLKNPTSKNSDAIRDQIQKLRSASGHTKPPPPPR